MRAQASLQVAVIKRKSVDGGREYTLGKESLPALDRSCLAPQVVTLAAIRKIKDWPWTFVDLSLDSSVANTFIQGARARMDNSKLLEDFNRQFVNLHRRSLDTYSHTEDTTREKPHGSDTVNASSDRQSSPAWKPSAWRDFTGSSSDRQGSPAWKTYAWWDSTTNSSNHQAPPARARSARCDSYRPSKNRGNSPLPRADAQCDPHKYSRDRRISPLRPKDAWWDPKKYSRDHWDSPLPKTSARWEPENFSRDRSNPPFPKANAWWDPQKKLQRSWELSAAYKGRLVGSRKVV